MLLVAFVRLEIAIFLHQRQQPQRQEREHRDRHRDIVAAEPDGYADRAGGPKSWETTNLLHLGRALTYAAGLRDETRGGHVREDFPTRDDAAFLHHTLLRRGDDDVLRAEIVEVPQSNLEGLDLDAGVGKPIAAQGDSK